MKTEAVEQLIGVMSTLVEENKKLHDDIKLLEHEYAELNEQFIKLEHEYSCLVELTATVDTNSTDVFELNEPPKDDEESNSAYPIPVEEMATTTPKQNDGIFPSPASACHSMVTGTTDQKCYALTAVLSEDNASPSAGKRVLFEQGLFEYRKDERGHNRFLPTEWFREYAVSHGILAEFVGHAETKKGTVKFSWYKVTPFGKQIIKDTASGSVTWHKFNGPDDHIPVKKN